MKTRDIKQIASEGEASSPSRSDCGRPTKQGGEDSASDEAEVELLRETLSGAKSVPREDAEKELEKRLIAWFKKQGDQDVPSDDELDDICSDLVKGGWREEQEFRYRAARILSRVFSERIAQAQR